ncbi:MAG: acyltransferase family protein [Promethearchaeota archaeon]
MIEIETVDESLDEDIREDTSSFFQIDFLKSIMIVFVIIDHSVLRTFIRGTGTELWERMSIPVFLVILGFNAGNSFARKGDKFLSELYSWQYFKKKFWRFIFPYIILYIVSTTAGFFIYGESFTDTFSDDWIVDYIIYQRSLLMGPGNWFIPVLFQSILLLPLMYKAFTVAPRLSLILSFLIEISFHLFVFNIIGDPSSLEDWLLEIRFRQTILLYTSALGMGLWFSKNYDLFSKKNLFLWFFFPISVLYMVAWDFFSFRFEIDGADLIRGDYNYLTFIYSAFIILIILKFIPKNPKNKASKIFTAIGRSSFHIYLVQDVYFSITYATQGTGVRIVDNIYGISFGEPIFDILLVGLNWAICITAGVFWWYIENAIRRYRKKIK